jgi:hypothetical protein
MTISLSVPRQRAKSIAGMVNRLHARRIRVIVFGNRIVPLTDRQPDGHHFSEKRHALAAAWLLRQVLGSAAQGGDSRSLRRQIARGGCDRGGALIGCENGDNAGSPSDGIPSKLCAMLV